MAARHLIIEVVQGRFRGVKAAVVPGQSLRVGRTDQADLVIAKDDTLSGVHFELAWDGTTGTLRDRESKEGTWLGGHRIEEATLRHGSWVRAGKTDFCIYVEAHTPARAHQFRDLPPHLDPETVASARRDALILLRREAASGQLHAVLDAARSPRILELLRESIEPYHSLYDGVQGEALAHAAPYLVRLSPRSRLLDDLVLEGWGRRWGLYLSSTRRLHEVRRHLRRFLMIELEETHRGRTKSVYFRFYDPGVMDLMWQVLSTRQRQALCSELSALMFERDLDASPMRVEPGS